MSDTNYLENMMEKQKELMARVPHTVRKEVYPTMVMTFNIIEDLFLYMNSLGHKPWRPTPLSITEQDKRFKNFLCSVARLREIHEGTGTQEVNIDQQRYEKMTRNMISLLGIIEESVEYHNSSNEFMALNGYVESNANAAKATHKKEEGVDMLFFWLEAMIQAGYTPKELYEAYCRKWNINIKRYESLEKGDTSWDKRSEGNL